MKKRKVFQIFVILYFVTLSWNGYFNISDNNKSTMKFIIYQNNSEFQLLDAKIDRDYCIFPNVFKVNNTEEERITLILHSSYDRIHKQLIEKHINNWQAPISISIVFPRYTSPSSGNVQCVYKIFKDLYKSNNNLIAEYLSVHFIIPKADICQSISAGPLPSEKQCQNLKKQEKEILQILNPNTRMEREVRKMAEYPVNFARNFARKQAITSYILIADMDHIFSEKFEYKMRDLASRKLTNGTKTVLVYRIFEINESSKRPKTKDDIKILLQKEEAMEFHSSFSLAHKIPYLDRWLDHEEENNNTTEIQYYHRFKKFAWEPQFVSRTDIPFHDESFSYPLRDNTVLRWELCRAEYRFAVVFDCFMFHPGIKTTQYRRKHDIVRRQILPYKKQALQEFRIRMNQTYPKTFYKCPKFYF